MIKSLYIKNFTIIDEIEIHFKKGLNIITGETGSGKSILVNALGQICGDRSSPDMVRQQTNKAVIEACLSVEPSSDLIKELQTNDIECDNFNEIFIRKEIYASGNTRVFFNDTPINMSRLNKISSRLIDIHGQHQHQRLLHPEFHIDYLDSFAGLSELNMHFSQLLENYNQAKQELEALKKKQKVAAEKQDLYRYQYAELNDAQLVTEEYENIKTEYNKSINIETIHEHCRQLISFLYEGDHNAGDNLVSGEKELDKLTLFDKEFVALKANLQNARETVEEIGRFAETYLSNISHDPERMEVIRQRIAQIEFLLKKYNKKSLDELIDYQNNLKISLQSIAGFGDVINKKQELIKTLIEKINREGLELSTLRRKHALGFQERITEQLREIGMVNAVFNIDISYSENQSSPFFADGKNIIASEKGFDQVLFQIIPNPGEEFRAINKIASGGEISRTMLSIKSILAETDNLPILIFDEIDNGISGKVAQIAGRKMKKLSEFHQLLCVTHLPQIAAFASEHICVLKEETDQEVRVWVKSLNMNERVEEIAHLLAGQDISVHALENAQHLIREAKILGSR